MKKISLIFMITIIPVYLQAQTANVDVATPTATAGNITSTSSGVGIGTTSPTSILHLKESASSDQKTVLKVEHEGVSGAWGGAMIELGSSSSTQALSRIIGSSNYSSTNSSTWGNNRSILAFQTMNSSGQWNTIQMDSDGRLGIGTTTPAEALDVIGNTNISGILKLFRVSNGVVTTKHTQLQVMSAGELWIQPENGFAYIRSQYTENNTLFIGGSWAEGQYGKYSHNKIRFTGNIDSDGNGTFDKGKVFVSINRDIDSYIDNDHGLVLGDNILTPGYRFEVDGNAKFSDRVSIGTITNWPSANAAGHEYKLVVDGAIAVKGCTVDGTGILWGDYVFDDEYELLSLDSLQTYVQKEKHLPGIQSANEVQTQGLEIGEMQTKQMVKIEELTLYLLEMNKEMKAMKKEMKTMKEKVEALKNENASLKQKN